MTYVILQYSLWFYAHFPDVLKTQFRKIIIQLLKSYENVY